MCELRTGADSGEILVRIWIRQIDGFIGLRNEIKNWVFRRGYTGWFWEPDFKGSIPFTQTGCEKTQVDWGLPAKQNFGSSILSSHSTWKGSSVGRAMV
jgi:hypothetical protein